ncbi:MAG TPA: hypothetical protein VK169_15900 [Saprospiraceae bacterium]|nr:hypothetical protein [Saprospiraceae bacterium]
MYKLVGFIIIFCSFTLRSQSLRFNPKIGFAEFDFNFEKESEVNPNILNSIGSDIRIGDRAYFINTGLHYSKDDFYNDRSQNFINQSIHFIRIPTQVGLYLTKRDGAFVMYIKGGLTNNIFLLNSGDANILNEKIARINLAGNLGFGFDLFKYANIGFDYDLELSNYFKIDPIIAKRNVYMFSVGLNFDYFKN